MNDKPLIAVVAMSGVFPKATGLSMFWDNIVNKVDATVVRLQRIGPLGTPLFRTKPIPGAPV